MNRLLQISLAAALLALPAFGQDSITIQPWGATIGDAVYPWDTTEQLNTYVVDLQAITSSMGNTFYLAPIVKSSKMSADYLNSLTSAQGASDTLLTDVPFPAAAGNSYGYWNLPEYGVNNNTALNYPPETWIDTTGWTGNQFSAVFAEFGNSADVSGVNSIVGAVVNFLPDEPHRLYVARIAAALNTDGVTPPPTGGTSGGFGIGSVDAVGNVHLRADDFGATGPNPLTGNNYFRVDMLARNFSVFNLIDGLGATDAAATTHLLAGSATTHSTPYIIPSDVAGRPVLLGANFDGQYVYENTPGAVTATLGHIDPLVADQRGSVAFSHRLTAQPGSVGTAGVLGILSGETVVHALNLWDVDADGNVLGTYALQAPSALDDTHGLPAGSPMADVSFGHYYSQTPYRGGNAPLALGVDQSGRGLAAGVVHQWEVAVAPGYDNPFNALLVGRFTPGDAGSVEWKAAAYVVDTLPGDPTYPWDGSPIYDETDTEIGRLCPLYLVTGGDVTTWTGTMGPSLSAPVIDSVGNIYFLASCEFYADPDPYHTNALIRAVYDPATFSYKLEAVFKNRDVFHGQNSDTDYQISFLEIADSNSVSSGTLWSGNIILSPDPTDPGKPDGLIVAAEIIYDADGDGVFDGTDLGPDEPYHVMLYVQAPPASAPCLVGDSNCDGLINAFDIDAFILAITDPAAWQATYPCDFLCTNDCNGDGAVNAFDIDPFIALLTGK